MTSSAPQANLPGLVYHSRQTDEWETPSDLFAVLDREFTFTVDAAAGATNHKCPRYWTMAENGLAQPWAGETVWINPPYSQAAKWLQKAAIEVGNPGTTIVLLTGARTGTRYWHEWVFPHAAEIRFLLGRVRFLSEGKPADSCPFDLAIIVYRQTEIPAQAWAWDWKAIR